MDCSQNDTYHLRRARLLLKLSGEKRDVMQTCAAIRGKPSPCLDAVMLGMARYPREAVALRNAIAFTIRQRREHKLRQPPSPPLLAEGVYMGGRTLVGHTAAYTNAWVWLVTGLLIRLVRAEHSVVDLPRADEWLKFPDHPVIDSRPRHFSGAHTDRLPHIVGIDYGRSDLGHVNPPQWPERLPPMRSRCTLDADRDRIHADILRDADAQTIPTVVLTRNEALRLGLKDGDVEDGKLVVVSKPITPMRERPAAVVGRTELLRNAADLDDRRGRPLLG